MVLAGREHDDADRGERRRLGLLVVLELRGRETVGAGELREHVRHRDVRKHDVVPARRRAVVLVEAEEIVVEPRRAAHAGFDGEVRRRDAEPGLRVGRPHRDRHRVADLVGREHQVVADLRLGEAEVRQPVVAHVLRGVAVEAVVDERPRAALLRREVEPVDRRRLEPDVGAAGGDARRTPTHATQPRARRARALNERVIIIRSPFAAPASSCRGRCTRASAGRTGSRRR